MRFNPQQDRGLCAVGRWLREGGDQVFRLFGYAGTGKTTLAKHLAEHVSGRVLFAAYTGKAAHVMRLKGCDGVLSRATRVRSVRLRLCHHGA